jgi:hypothetical protein
MPWWAPLELHIVRMSYPNRTSIALEAQKNAVGVLHEVFLVDAVESLYLWRDDQMQMSST